MSIFFVQARLHPVARWIINFVGGALRLCLLLLCIATVVFALVGVNPTLLSPGAICWARFGAAGSPKHETSSDPSQNI